MGIGNDGTEGTPPPVNDGGSDFNLDGLPPEILKKISDLETVVKTLSEGFEQNKKSAEEAQQMQQLDNMMKELHTKHGEFDDEYLLLQLQKGLTPDQAIEQWNKFTEGIVNSRPKKQPPVIFSGAGQTQSGQVDPSKLSGQDRIKYIAGMLEASRG